MKEETEITKGPKDTNAEREYTTEVNNGDNRSGANENIIQKEKCRHIDNGRSILGVQGTNDIDESNNLMVDNSEDSNGQRKKPQVSGDKEKELKRIATTEIRNKR